MRLFFALSLSDADKLAIERWRDQHLPAASKFIPAYNYHITLAFLGQSNEKMTDELCQSTATWLSTKHFGPLCLQLDQCRYWPQPGILWVGPTQWPEVLVNLQQFLSGLGQRVVGASKSKKPFQPHVSIMRSKTLPAKAISEPDLPLKCYELALYESIPKRQGVHYNALSTWELAPAPRLPTAAMKPHKRPPPRQKF